MRVSRDCEDPVTCARTATTPHVHDLDCAAMTATVRAGAQGGDSSALEGPASLPTGLRIAILDRDSGFIQVLSKRLDRLGWAHRVLASPVPSDAVVSMRLSALVVDLAVL